MDENDCAPKFYDKRVTARVVEDAKPGQIVFRLSAVDNDISPANKRILYRLLNKHPKLLPFDLDRDSGELTVKDSSYFPARPPFRVCRKKREESGG